MKYLNLEGFLEKSLKIKYTFKSTGKSLKGLEKSLNSSSFCSTPLLIEIWTSIKLLCLYLVQHLLPKYEGCSNMNASSSITFFTYMLRQNAISFWKELLVAFRMAPNIKQHSLYFSSYRPLYKEHSCILKFFWSKFQCTFWYMCGYSVISL